MKSLRLCAGFVFLLASIACTSRQFHEDDIARTETDIRTNFEQHGFTVEQVSLVKESDRRLSGFVKFRKSSGLFSKAQLNKNCVATMDIDSGKWIWECK
jgi:virulence-associated protein VapD